MNEIKIPQNWRARLKAICLCVYIFPPGPCTCRQRTPSAKHHNPCIQQPLHQLSYTLADIGDLPFRQYLNIIWNKANIYLFLSWNVSRGLLWVLCQFVFAINICFVTLSSSIRYTQSTTERTGQPAPSSHLHFFYFRGRLLHTGWKKMKSKLNKNILLLPLVRPINYVNNKKIIKYNNNLVSMIRNTCPSPLAPCDSVRRFMTFWKNKIEQKV